MSEDTNLYEHFLTKEEWRNMCRERHDKIDDNIKELFSKLNWFTFFVIGTFGGVITELVLTVIKH